jgi:hypothetical protein
MLDKTDKGREEITTRKYGLAPRLRTLLLLIDGKNAKVDLLKKVSGLGLNEQGITELLENGFIQAISDEPPVKPISVTANSPASMKATTAEMNAVPTIAGAKPGAAGPTESATENHSTAGSHASQFQALYYFYTETIKTTIGLRGYGLQLKVERAGSIDDFRELRQLYLEAVLKAKGNEVARSLGDRLDQLLKQ